MISVMLLALPGTDVGRSVVAPKYAAPMPTTLPSIPQWNELPGCGHAAGPLRSLRQLDQLAGGAVCIGREADVDRCARSFQRPKL